MLDDAVVFPFERNIPRDVEKKVNKYLRDTRGDEEEGKKDEDATRDN